jgi:hypothetical protein
VLALCRDVGVAVRASRVAEEPVPREPPQEAPQHKPRDERDEGPAPLPQSDAFR